MAAISWRNRWPASSLKVHEPRDQGPFGIRALKLVMSCFNLLLPLPGGSENLVQIALCDPTQDRFGARRICVERGRIAGAGRRVGMRHIEACEAAEGLHQLMDGCAAAGTEIEAYGI